MYILAAMPIAMLFGWCVTALLPGYNLSFSTAVQELRDCLMAGAVMAIFFGIVCDIVVVLMGRAMGIRVNG